MTGEASKTSLIKKYLLWLFLAVIFFVIFSLIVHFTRITTTEITIFRFVNHLPSGANILIKYFMYLGTYLGTLIFLGLALIIKKRYLFYQLLTASIFALLLSYLSKVLVNRVRPIAIISDLITRTSEKNLLSYGFPSGHTTMATALTIVLWPYVKKPYRYFLLIIPLLMGLARMYVGVHFPLDVIGGLFLGLIIGYFTRLLIPEKRTNPN